MTEVRRRRQRAEVLATGRAGDLARAVALARDHLLEFPDDGEVRDAVVAAVEACGDARLRDEGRALLGEAGIVSS